MRYFLVVSTSVAWIWLPNVKLRGKEKESYWALHETERDGVLQNILIAASGMLGALAVKCQNKR